MANVFVPFGFADSHRLGAAVNYQMSRRWILATNATPIFSGDPVVSNSQGYIQRDATIGTPHTQPQITGIFIGCEYMSISQKKWIASAWWPGNDAVVSGTGFDVMAKVIDDPLTAFRVQVGTSSGGAVPAGLPSVGQNIDYNLGTGNTVTGKSAAWADTFSLAAPGSTLPFRVVDLVRDPPGSNGADPTTAYNWIYVTFNNQDFKVTAGI
jgi:hypothetical protein